MISMWYYWKKNSSMRQGIKYDIYRVRLAFANIKGIDPGKKDLDINRIKSRIESVIESGEII